MHFPGLPTVVRMKIANFSALMRNENGTAESTTSSNDILNWLKADHERIRKSMLRLQQSDGRSKKLAVFIDLKRELDLHARVEAEVLYPAAARMEAWVDLLEVFADDHEEMKDLCAEILAGVAESDEDSDDLDLQLQDLMDEFEDHIEEEEEELFPALREQLTRDEFATLNASFRDFLVQGNPPSVERDSKAA